MPTIMERLFTPQGSPQTLLDFTRMSLAATAYLALDPSDYSTIANLLGADTVTNVPRPNVQGGQAIVCRRAPWTVVAFEGTRGSLESWWQYARGAGVSNSPTGEGTIFTPFLYQANQCFPGVTAHLTQNDHVIWTGHSLGAVLAKLVPTIAYPLRRYVWIDSRTFACPRFADTSFANGSVRGEMASINFDVDPVPLLPCDVLSFVVSPRQHLLVNDCFVDVGSQRTYAYAGGDLQNGGGYGYLRFLAAALADPWHNAHQSYRYMLYTATLAGVGIERGPGEYQRWCAWLAGKGLFQPWNE